MQRFNNFYTLNIVTKLFNDDEKSSLRFSDSFCGNCRLC